MDAVPRQVTFQPVRPRRAFEEICERIRDQLALGVLRPGDKLPAERELAQQFGVGRSALREALRSLEIAGVIELRKGVKGGAFVREGDPGAMRQVLEDLLHLGSITLEELTEARLFIQDVIVRLACRRATKADFEALRKNIERTDEMTRAGRYLERLECSREFYDLLSAATHNQVLSVIMRSVTEILMRFLRTRIVAAGRTEPRLVQKRQRFLDALVARDVERARDEMRSHLESVHRLLKKSKT